MALHILFISSWYPNRVNRTHGIFNLEFARCVSSFAKVSVLHVSPDPALVKGFEMEKTTEQDILTVRVYYPPAGKQRGFFSKALQHYRRTIAYKLGYRIIAEALGKPDLIHLNVVYPAGAGVRMLSRRYKIPYVVNECWTGYDPADGRYSGAFLKLFTKAVIAGSRRVLPVSSYVQHMMQRHGLNGNYEVVPNVVDTQVFNIENKRSGFTFIHISALDNAQKNVNGILRAFAAALKINKDITLQIVGDGDDAVYLMQLSKQLGLEHSVQFKGKLNREEVASAINDSLALVMFSNYETLCLTIPEALACGRPVITSNAGGVMSYFNSNLGIAVPVGNEKALTNAMLQMASSASAYNRQELRAFAVKHFGVEVIKKKLQLVYREVLA